MFRRLQTNVSGPCRCTRGRCRGAIKVSRKSGNSGAGSIVEDEITRKIGSEKRACV